MTKGQEEPRKRTMAEEEAEKEQSSTPGCRRSLRRKNNRITTSQYRRMRQLFWQDEEDEEDDEEEDSAPIRFGKLKLQKLHSNPNIYIIDDFMTASELSHCDSLIQKQHFSKSFVDNEEHAPMEEQRTSSFVALEKMQSSPIANLERRAAELLGFSIEQIEPLQLVRYREGEFFGVHHDLGVLFEDNSVELPERKAWSRRRVATLFCYLNNVDSGGCTWFPNCGNLRVQPKRGRAVLWSNILENGMPDPDTIHAGEAVLANPNSNEPVCKYGMNIWACEE